jgi:hypothetical protein
MAGWTAVWRRPVPLQLFVACFHRVIQDFCQCDDGAKRLDRLIVYRVNDRIHFGDVLGMLFNVIDQRRGLDAKPLNTPQGIRDLHERSSHSSRI